MEKIALATKLTARDGHAACPSPDQTQMLMYGGDDRRSMQLADLWAFGLETEQWRELRQQGAGPDGRQQHIMLTRGSDTFVGFGVTGG